MEDIFVRIGVKFLDDQHYEERSAYSYISKGAITTPNDDNFHFICKYIRNKPQNAHYAIDGEHNLLVNSFIQMNIRQHEYIVNFSSDVFISRNELTECIRNNTNTIVKQTLIDSFMLDGQAEVLLEFEHGPCAMYLNSVTIIVNKSVCDNWVTQYYKYKKHLSCI